MSNRPTVLYNDFLLLKKVCEQCLNQFQARIDSLEKTVKELESRIPAAETVEVQ